MLSQPLKTICLPPSWIPGTAITASSSTCCAPCLQAASTRGSCQPVPQVTEMFTHMVFALSVFVSEDAPDHAAPPPPREWSASPIPNSSPPG